MATSHSLQSAADDDAGHVRRLSAVYILSCSFSDRLAVTGGKVWLLPVQPTLFAYDLVLKYQKIWSGYYNSIIYMVLGTVIGMSITILAWYPLARRGFVGKKHFSWLFMFTMLFNGGLIPTHLWINDIKMVDTLYRASGRIDVKPLSSSRKPHVLK